MRTSTHHTVYLVAFCVLLLGCRNANSAFSPDGRKRVSLNLLLISTKQLEHYRWIEKSFEELHPDVDVVFEQFPGSSLKDYEIKLRLRFASGRAPDVFGLNVSVAGAMARLGLLDPAPPFIQDRVQGNSRTDMIRSAPYFDGLSCGIVSDAGPTVLFFNKDHYRTAGLDPNKPPATWDELIETADRLTLRDVNGEPTRAGLSLRKTGFKPGIAEKWLTFLYSAGGEPFDDRGTRATFNSDAGRTALEFYETVLFDRKIDSIELEGDQQGFAHGNSSMFIREVYVVQWLRDNFPNIDFGVAPIPALERSVSSGGPYMFVVSEDAVHKEEAWRLVEYMMSDEVYRRYAAIGGVIPAVASIANEPRYRDDEELAVFVAQDMIAIEPFPLDQRVTDLLGAYIERFCYGHLDVQTTLERAEADINKILAANSETQPSS